MKSCFMLMKPWVEHAWNKEKMYVYVLHVACMNEVLFYVDETLGGTRMEQENNICTCVAC